MAKLQKDYRKQPFTENLPNFYIFMVYQAD